MKKIGVCLSGCGVMDGSEIHEAVLTLLAIDRAGAAAVCTAPEMNQRDVVDHVANRGVAGDSRSVFAESARIARGQIRPLRDVTAEQLDALVFPGGFGAAKNLSDFALNGADCRVHPEVERLVLEMAAAKKPIGAMCIAPAILAAVFRGRNVALTIGDDVTTASTLGRMGATHRDCLVGDIVIDRQHKLVSTPAYMLATRISQAAEGIEKLVKAILEMA